MIDPRLRERDADRMVRLFKDGMSVKGIAFHTGYHPRMVKSLLREIGILTVRQRRDAASRKRRAEKLALYRQAMELARAGVSSSEISRRIPVPRSTVSELLRREGLNRVGREKEREALRVRNERILQQSSMGMSSSEIAPNFGLCSAMIRRIVQRAREASNNKEKQA